MEYLQPTRSYVICVKPNVFVLLPPNTGGPSKLRNDSNKDWILQNIVDSHVVTHADLPPPSDLMLWLCEDKDANELFVIVNRESVSRKETVKAMIQYLAQNRMHSLSKVQPMKVKQ